MNSLDSKYVKIYIKMAVCFFWQETQNNFLNKLTCKKQIQPLFNKNITTNCSHANNDEEMLGTILK